ncbi:hypothetical protein OIU83_04610 [Flavobacterium sp. LS1R49]|uniref:Uncharacterized protein n=1 Tax=Flavobacterium shii TaxID=2987687 RepID=A0A9X2ZC25_9FLAO|nr:hypothetical protein [Flavobacterium shii]MCV9926917.1 hypothetical protein [Flavobacterium shii]
MSYTLIIGGKLIIRAKGDIKSYAKENIEINSVKKINITGANNGVSFNKPKKGLPVEKMALAKVEFRTLAAYKGEFGFDWLRLKDNGLNLEPDYKSIIEGGYKDGISDLTKIEAYKKLKSEYKQIPVIVKAKTAGGKPSVGEYFVPYLNLFSKKFSDTITATTPPPFEATLRVLVDIGEDLDKLEFEYDKTIFTIDKPVLSDKNKTGGLVASAGATIKITCNEDITSDALGIIKVFAYPKDSGVKSKPEQLALRKLAGKIIVGKNDASQRKEQKFVLVGIKTNVTKSLTGTLIGGFTPDEKTNLCNALYQALIVPILENSPNELDVSSNPHFQTGGKYIESSNKINEDTNGFFADVKNIFLNDKDAAGVLKNNKYKTGYFTVFSLAAQVYDEAKGQIHGEQYLAGGKWKMRFLKNLLLFPNKDFCTMNHEGLHGMGLLHTHADSNPIEDSDVKYVYPNALTNPLNSTDNIMCYRDVAYTTWKWQWSIMRRNV